jgi:predicted dehydrogenase
VAAGSTALSASRVAGANSRISLGMIGPGFRGLQLIWSLRDPNAEFVAFADAYNGRLEPARRKANAPSARLFTDYRRLLEDRSIDAVFIVTPQHLHCEHFVASLQAGKHVYQEKTMAFSVAHARRMRAACRAASGLTVQIGHQECSSGQLADAAGMLRAGILGKITSIHAHMYRNTPHNKPQWTRPIPADMAPANVDWRAFLGENPDRPFDANRFLNWRFFWDYSGGNYYENMSHQLCFWYKLLDLAIPTRVNASGGVFPWKDGREVPDTMNAAMIHPEELLFTWNSAFGNNDLGTTEHVLGTDGTIFRDERISYRPQAVNRPGASPLEGRAVDHGQQHLDIAHLQNFLDCIRSGAEPACPFDLAFRVSIACRMDVDSCRRGRMLRWDPQAEEIVG